MRRNLTIGDRVEILTGLKAGWSLRAISHHLAHSASVISREIRRNFTKTRGYQVVTADCTAERSRGRPPARKISSNLTLKARVLADLAGSQTPRQIAGQLRLEPENAMVRVTTHSPPADGLTVVHV